MVAAARSCDSINRPFEHDHERSQLTAVAFGRVASTCAHCSRRWQKSSSAAKIDSSSACRDPANNDRNKETLPKPNERAPSTVACRSRSCLSFSAALRSDRTCSLCGTARRCGRCCGGRQLPAAHPRYRRWPDPASRFSTIAPAAALAGSRQCRPSLRSRRACHLTGRRPPHHRYWRHPRSPGLCPERRTTCQGHTSPRTWIDSFVDGLLLA